MERFSQSYERTVAARLRKSAVATCVEPLRAVWTKGEFRSSALSALLPHGVVATPLPNELHQAAIRAATGKPELTSHALWGGPVFRNADGLPRQVVILWRVVLALVLSLSKLLCHQAGGSHAGSFHTAGFGQGQRLIFAPQN